VARDLRVCFVGDSFVAGFGDPEYLGWVGRVAARSHRAGLPLTAYNLGIRGQTSQDVLTRWHQECTQRLPSGCDARVVMSVGVNDTTVDDGEPRVSPKDSVVHLGTLLDQAAAADWPALVVGPPPVADEQQNRRTVSLDPLLERVCRNVGVGYISVFEALLVSTTWMRQVDAGDGSHPAGGGYDELSELVWPHWLTWIGPPGAPDR